MSSQTYPKHWLRWFCLAFLLYGITAVFARTPGEPAALGMWEGESKCTVADSPCHDEHVLYRVVADKQDPNRVLMDAYKIVKGEQQFMGAIECRVPSVTSLSCSANTQRKNVWEFQISGDTMTGTLTVDESKTLYRKISVRRTTTRLQASPATQRQ